MFNLQKIKDLINEKRWSNTDFSKKIGVSNKTLYNYLENKSVIDVEVLQKIADVLEVPVTYFYENESNNKCEYNSKQLLYYIDFIERFYGIDGIKLRDEFTKQVASISSNDPDNKETYVSNMVRLSNLVIKFHETARVLQEMRGKFPEANFDNYIKEW